MSHESLGVGLGVGVAVALHTGKASYSSSCVGDFSGMHAMKMHIKKKKIQAKSFR
jgi:hypothetical protein